MVNVRACIAAAFLLFGFSALSHAQVAFGGGGGAGNFTCAANVANPTQVRAEGHSELLGDIVIVCTGGAQLITGGPVPTANITVTLANTYVTSRIFDSSGRSEAMLLVDEPGTDIVAGAPVGSGFPMTECLVGGTAPLVGAAAGGCTQTIGTATPPFGLPTVYSAVSATGTVINAYQGVIASGSNQVVFNGIAILPPVTPGYARVFRVTNVRADAAVAASGGASIVAGVTIGGGIPLSGTVLTVANIFNGLSSPSVRNASNSAAASSMSLSQCVPAGLTPGAVLRFPEGFATNFKTRIAPTSTLSGAATPRNSTVTASVFRQNVPGLVYSGSESDFIFDVPGGTAGLADFGSRLKATFSNLPAGVNIYVSTTNINPLGNSGVNPAAGTNLTAPATAVAAGNFAAMPGVTSLLAGLVSSESAIATAGQSLPLVPPTNTSGGVALYGPLPVDANGSATAVWEILLSNPAAQETAEFAVFYTSSNAAPTLTPGTVALSYAPTVGSVLIPRFAPAASSTSVVTVAACTAVASVGLVSSANPATYGQPVTFTATVSGNGVTPTGTVTFKDGAVALRTATLATGQAAFTTAALGGGSHSITAQYSGDGNYPAATSAAVTQAINRASTATILSFSSSAVPVGQLANLTAVVTSGAGAPTGLVTFRDGNLALRSVLVDGSGTARLAIQLAPGDHNLTATYEGDANFAPSATAAQRLTVSRNPVSVSTPVVRSGSLVAGELLSIAATVSGNSAFTPTLSFRDSGVLLGDAPIDASGTAVITVRLGPGGHAISASYAGDAQTESAVSGVLFLTIRSTPLVTLSITPNPATSGSAITLSAAVAPPPNASITPVGTVTFTDGATTLGTASLNASGQASLNLPAGLAAGDHTLVAAYGGDTNYVAASSAPVVERVTRVTTATTLSESVVDGAFYLTAAVTTSGPGTPSGSVQFADINAGATLGTAALSNGAATVRLAAPLPIGRLLVASYGGDTLFAPSDSPRQSFFAAVNGFSYLPVYAPDAIATVFGAALSSSTETAPGLPLPDALGGVKVTFVDVNGHSHAALLYYVSPTQINFVVPADLDLGPAKLTITSPGGSWTLAVTIARVAPALTSADGSGSGLAAAQVIRVHSDGVQDSLAVSATPIAFGDGDRLFLVLYGTGLRRSSGGVQCSLNGQPVAPLFAGPQGGYPGLDQVNLELPHGLAGLVVVSCSAEGATSNSVTVSVR
jgi:uncharacterized protein (TIGR03437 family)